MAETQNAQNGFDFETQGFDLVRAALDPDERKFLKMAMGKDSPGPIDYLAGTGQFTRAREQRDMIRGLVAQQGIAAMQRQALAPTVGDVQTLFPGHNELIPPGAYKPTPQAPLQSDEMPVMTGIQKAVVPDTRFQGPMPGVRTALGDFTQRQKDDVGRAGLSLQQNTALDTRDPYMFMEGPRPTRTVTTGVYSPDQAPAQSMELDKSMKLPPVFQAQVGALQHQLSTRQTQPHYPSAEEKKLDMGMMLGLQAWQETHPGQPVTAAVLNDIFTQATGGYNKENKPGSLGERKASADARIAEIAADLAKPKGEAELKDVGARTAHYEAQTKELTTLLDAKLKKLMAEASAAEAVGSKESINAFYKEQQALLNKAKALIELAQEGRKGKTMDDVSYAKIMDLALQDLNAGVQAEAKQRSWLEKQFGTERPVEITPRPADEPMKRLVPPGMPQGIPQSTLPPAQPERAPEPEIEDKAAKQAFGRTLKDGETKSFRGKKYMRKGNQLIEVR